MPLVKKPRVTAVARRDVITRRLANPMGNESLEIPSHPKGKWIFYIGNSAMAPDRIWRLRQRKGWEFALPEDSGGGGTPEDFGFDQRNGRLVRGDRGSEVLMKMDVDEWKLIQQAKSDANTKAMKGIKDIPQRAASELGDEGPQAADFLHQSLKHVEITEKREVVRAEDYQS